MDCFKKKTSVLSPPNILFVSKTQPQVSILSCAKNFRKNSNVRLILNSAVENVQYKLLVYWNIMLQVKLSMVNSSL